MEYDILVPFDFSDGAEAALAWAANLAKASGGKVRLVHCVPLVPAAAAPMMAPGPTPEERADLLRKMHEAAKRHNVEASADIVRSPQTSLGIVEAAHAMEGINLIVMGTHGLGGFRRAVLGSVADGVVRHADCPVVTVRHPARKA